MCENLNTPFLINNCQMSVQANEDFFSWGGGGGLSMMKLYFCMCTSNQIHEQWFACVMVVKCLLG